MTQPLPQGDCEVGQLPVDENRVIITLSNATESQGASVASSVDGRLANAEGTDVETSRLPRARSLRKRKGEKLGDWEVAFKKIRASLRLKTIEQVRDEIIQQSAGDPDVVVVERPKLSLICPISGKRIETAARGVGCTHLHCFDLAAFLKQQSQTPFWDCPFSFCEQKILLEDLVIDKYSNLALQVMDAVVEEIELRPDGSFLPVETPNVVPEEVDDTDYGIDAKNDDDPQVHANAVHVVSATVLRELEAALENVGDRLKNMTFTYLSRVNESFNGLYEFA
ncbi:CRE-GEI-17 protein, partial [Aphelenchoides avenae]